MNYVFFLTGKNSKSDVLYVVENNVKKSIDGTKIVSKREAVLMAA